MEAAPHPLPEDVVSEVGPWLVTQNMGLWSPSICFKLLQVTGSLFKEPLRPGAMRPGTMSPGAQHGDGFGYLHFRLCSNIFLVFKKHNANISFSMVHHLGM